MDYSALLDLSAELGYRLAMAGAETFRIEESITRMLAAYGIPCEVFVITNCLHVSIEKPDGTPMTRMRRIGHHGNDLDAVERYNNLSRRICTSKPEPTQIQQWLDDTRASCKQYPFLVFLLGNFLGASGFTILFGGSLLDALWSGLCGVLIGLANHFLSAKKVNAFFTTIATAFLMAFTAYAASAFGLTHNSDTVIIGAIMILVPGLLFTNAMRDIIFGDTNSGTNRIVQVLLVAAAIALGTGVAWNFAEALWNLPINPTPLAYSFPIQCAATIVACIGFVITFNVHGKGFLLCPLGSAICWCVYYFSGKFGCSEILAYFFAGIACAAYSEVMARIRKCPAIAYLVISIFPIIPGAGIYYTTGYLVKHDMALFAEKGTQTIAIAGVIAVGILMVSTIVRLWSSWKQSKQHKKELR